MCRGGNGWRASGPANAAVLCFAVGSEAHGAPTLLGRHPESGPAATCSLQVERRPARYYEMQTSCFNGCFLLRSLLSFSLFLPDGPKPVKNFLSQKFLEIRAGEKQRFLASGGFAVVCIHNTEFFQSGPFPVVVLHSIE